MRSLPLALLLGAVLASPRASASAQESAPLRRAGETQPNVLIVIADDFGVDLPSTYGEGAVPACMPTLDQLAAEGMLFRNFWAEPICSPTRAALLTGRHPFRNGIGGVVRNRAGLRYPQTILPEALPLHDNAWLGKWHLAGNLGDDHPNRSGFLHYAGTMGGAPEDYFSFTKVTNGQTSTETTYATTDTADDAIDAVMNLAEPWLIVASFNAVHSPFHQPPAGLCPSAGCPGGFCGQLGPNPTDAELVKSVAEGLDTELGRLLTVVDGFDPGTFVFFLGDNGTPRSATEAPFVRDHAKGSLYEGGVNVPLIVRGPGVVPGSECAGLVGVTDLFATVLELCGRASSAEDSVSLVPYFSRPARPSLRDFVYAERYSPNHGDLPFDQHTRAVRDRRFKLIRESGQPDLLFDLRRDPWESTNLLPNLNSAQQAAYDALVGELLRLGVQ